MRCHRECHGHGARAAQSPTCQTAPVTTSQPPLSLAELRPATPADDAAILAWNEADVHFLAAMDRPRLEYLKERAAAVEIIEEGGQACGFVITFTSGSDYDSPNYRWFSRLGSGFHYVDRIVIDPACRGRGLARRVYAVLAQRYPQHPLVAEVNYAPPNPASLAMHTAIGFVEVGRLGDRTNGVVMLRRPPEGALHGLG